MLRQYRGVLVVFGLFAAGWTGIFLATHAEEVKCRALGYDKHYARFIEPGLFDKLAAEAENDPRLYLVRRDGSPLVVDDPALTERLEPYLLEQVAWSDGGVQSRYEPDLISISVGTAMLHHWTNVTVEAFLSPSGDAASLRGQIGSIIDRLATVPAEERDRILDDIVSRLAGSGWVEAETPLETQWLRLGDLFLELGPRETKLGLINGDAWASWDDFTFAFRTREYLEFESEMGGPSVLFAHSDGSVYVYRNSRGNGTEGTPMSDRSFVNALENVVRELGIPEPSMEGLHIGNLCGSRCVKCFESNYTVDLSP